MPKAVPDPLQNQQPTSGWKMIAGLALGLGIALLGAAIAGAGLSTSGGSTPFVPEAPPLTSVKRMCPRSFLVSTANLTDVLQ